MVSACVSALAPPGFARRTSAVASSGIKFRQSIIQPVRLQGSASTTPPLCRALQESGARARVSQMAAVQAVAGPAVEVGHVATSRHASGDCAERTKQALPPNLFPNTHWPLSYFLHRRISYMAEASSGCQGLAADMLHERAQERVGARAKGGSERKSLRMHTLRIHCRSATNYSYY
jgi:hypothetical protein